MTESPLILADPERPAWGFGEIFAGASVFLVAIFGIASIARHYLGDAARSGTWEVAQEFGAYALLFSALKALFYFQKLPLLRSLGWVRTNFDLTPLVGIGLGLFFLGALLQVLLRTPDNIDTPFEKMLSSDRFSLIAITVFGVTIGPIIEELLFRGLIQPVLISAAGVFPGILVTSILFAAPHLPQNGNAWQSGVIIGLAGFGFGLVRHLTGSTRASTISHIAYNSLPFALTLAQGAQHIHK